MAKLRYKVYRRSYGLQEEKLMAAFDSLLEAENYARDKRGYAFGYRVEERGENVATYDALPDDGFCSECD